MLEAPVPCRSIVPSFSRFPPLVAIPIPLIIVFPLVVPIVLFLLLTTFAFVPTIPIDEFPSKFIVPLFIALGGFPLVSSVANEPLSTLIAIFCLFSVLLTVIVPFVSFVISSAACVINTIPVLPLPPDTLICPLFLTFPFHALIAFEPV